MRKSKALKKFREGRCARVCNLGHYLPFFVRHAAHFNYDVIWLDLEHRAMSAREVQSLLAMCHANDIDCMVRSPSVSRTHLYRYLEDGAAGVMIPFASDVDIARSIVTAVKFPPLGNRGLDGAGLDADFGFEVWRPDSTYTTDANQETFVVLQIETREALENVDEIAAVPGIDVLFVGPADLGLRLRQKTDGPPITLEDAIPTVAEAARRHDKAWGMPAPTPEKIAQYRELGAQFLSYGGDFALKDVLDRGSHEFDEVLDE